MLQSLASRHFTVYTPTGAEFAAYDMFVYEKHYGPSIKDSLEISELLFTKSALSEVMRDLK